MKALLLGSIGTLADTSEIQREAFNAAFRKHGLDWHWPRDEYRARLHKAGGKARIAAEAEARGQSVDVAGLHATKSELFQHALASDGAQARPGLRETITLARARGVAVGLVTTTSRANVDAILSALSMDRSVFDVIVTEEEVASVKPAPDAYHHAAATLAVPPEECVVVEDNPDGVRAAISAGMTCIAWPGENNVGQDFGGADLAGEDISASVVADRIAAE